MTDVPAQLASALADRYRLERALGAGGMATVYLAEDLRHKRRVALKVLRPELAHALGPERFLREIETTANLRHPHILPLYDSGMTGLRDDGTSEERATAHPPHRPPAEFLFYVMPYVEGETLRDRLDREKQLPVEEALQITREVADALSYAHSRGVIHRDIKPGLVAAGRPESRVQFRPLRRHEHLDSRAGGGHGSATGSWPRR